MKTHNTYIIYAMTHLYATFTQIQLLTYTFPYVSGSVKPSLLVQGWFNCKFKSHWLHIRAVGSHFNKNDQLKSAINVLINYEHVWFQPGKE